MIYVFTSVKAEDTIIPDEAIRFRVIANSNTIYDQNIKVQLKNVVQNKIFELTKGTETIEETRKILKDNIKTAERLDKKYPNINANNIDDLLNERDFSAIRQARLLSWCIESNEMIKRKFQEILKKYLYMSNGEVHDKFFELYKNDIVLYRNALAHIKNTPSIDSKVIIGEVDGKAVQFDQQLCDALRKKLLSYENILDEMYMFIESNF